MIVDVPEVDSLLEFRTVWLCAIAKSWNEPKFRRSLLDSEHAEDLLSETFRPYTWPWKGVLTLSVFDAKKFKYGVSNWIFPPTPAEEGFTIHVPLEPPKGSDPKDHPSILAEYYRQRPSLLTPGGGALKGWSFAVSPTFREHLSSPPTPIFPASAALTAGAPRETTDATPTREFFVSSSALKEGPSAGKGSLIPNITDFANFEVALLHAVAKAWHSKSFRDQLQEKPAQALATCEHFHPAWKMTLRIADDDKARWDPSQQMWRDLSPNALVLSLPQTPPQVEKRPVALAQYNATGAEYPFSCCP